MGQVNKRTSNRLDWQKLFQMLTCNNAEGVFMLDKDGNIVEANEAFTSLLGYPGNERCNFAVDRIMPTLNLNELPHSEINMQQMVHSILEELTLLEDPERIPLNIKPIPLAWADPKLIRQAWVNLFTNATMFSAKKEKIVIEVGSQTGEEEFIYYVKDNGAGFNMLYVVKLFGVFQRLHTDREFPGSGIGLAIAKRIIDRHGGRVWADSQPGQGAVFYFTLPKKPIH
jgi:PAS domain S-box-containing protein